MHPKDFRGRVFNISILIDSSKYAGNRFYYKLFVVENLIRIIINSILKKEYPSNIDWWDNGVPSKIKKNWHSLTSHHAIYNVYLQELNTIMVNNRNLIEQHISDLDNLILDIELINLPRRKIAHTKFLNSDDITKLDRLYIKSKKIISSLSKNITIEIP